MKSPIFHCPYCGEEDLRPSAAVERGAAWECGSCARVFSVELHEVNRDLVTRNPTPGSTSGPGSERNRT